MKGPADLAKGWFAKAESDPAGARALLAGPGPYDTACFHLPSDSGVLRGELSGFALQLFEEAIDNHGNLGGVLVGSIGDGGPNSGDPSRASVELTGRAGEETPEVGQFHAVGRFHSAGRRVREAAASSMHIRWRRNLDGKRPEKTIDPNDVAHRYLPSARFLRRSSVNRT